jgi:hypothetical protein
LEPRASDTTLSLAGSQYGAFHSLPIGTSFKIFKNFSLNPSLVWNEYWFPRAIEYSEDSAGNIKENVVKGFKRTSSFTGTGITLTTNIYGQFNFRNSKLMAIRHTLTPSIGYSYSPDFTDPRYQSFQQIENVNGYDRYRNYDKNDRLRLPRFKAFNSLYGYPQGRESSAMSFSLNNVFQGKVRTPKDTVNASKKISLLDRLSIGGFYDFKKDTMKLSPLSIGATLTQFLILTIMS